MDPRKIGDGGFCEALFLAASGARERWNGSTATVAVAASRLPWSWFVRGTGGARVPNILVLSLL